MRDKDGNGARIMFSEVAAYAKTRGKTIDQLLDEIFATFGYFQEKNGSIYFEGAEGAQNAGLLESYTAAAGRNGRAESGRHPDFEKDTIRDVEGDMIPKEKMSIFELADKTRIAVRGSGTEPKIKYYFRRGVRKQESSSRRNCEIKRSGRNGSTALGVDPEGAHAGWGQ